METALDKGSLLKIPETTPQPAKFVERFSQHSSSSSQPSLSIEKEVSRVRIGNCKKLILSQNTSLIANLYSPQDNILSLTMTTRPSRKSPSSLLAATQASSARTRTRSSSRLAAKGDKETTGIDATMPDGAKNKAADATSSPVVAAVVGIVAGNDAPAVTAPAIATVIIADGDASGTEVDPLNGKSVDTAGKEVAVGVGKFVDGAEKETSALAPASTATTSVTAIDPHGLKRTVESNSGSNTFSNGIDLSYSDAVPKTSFRAPGTEAEPSISSKKLYSEVTGTMPSRNHIPTGVVTGINEASPDVNGTADAASTTPPTTTVAVTVDSATDTNPSPKNLYSIFASKMPSKTPPKTPTLTLLGKA